MGCYCSATSHPPCSWCERSFECEICHKVKSEFDGDEAKKNQMNGEVICMECFGDLHDAGDLEHYEIRNPQE